MKATGNTKIIIKTVNEIQNLIGEARGLHYDDKDPHAFLLAQKKLQEAFDLCVKITGMYDPI